MSPPSIRSQRVADRIRRVVALVLQRHTEDPRLAMMTVTAVEMSSDIKTAFVYYILPSSADRQEVAKVIEKATPFIRRELSKQLNMRYTPSLRFRFDASIERASHLLSLMDDDQHDDPSNDEA